MMAGEGILALWMDRAPERAADLERWFQTEHSAERLAVPGFLSTRRHEAIEAERDCFCYYVTESPDVLTSEAYLARVGDPTPLTRTIMSEVMRNMSRTICRVERRVGAFHGPVAATIELAEPDEAMVAAFMERKEADVGVARTEFWRAAQAAGEPSEEERLRGGDKKIAACLLVETLREADARRVIAEARESLGAQVASVGLYRLVSELR